MVNLEQMLNCRVHLGHKVKKWNPKMSPYIFGTRCGVHIIDLVQTYISLKKVSKFLVGARRNNKTCELSFFYFNFNVCPTYFNYACLLILSGMLN